MWGTVLLDVYRRQDAQELRDGLERLLGPESGSAWATGGVYVFWNPETRDPLYVGITGDFPERFAQHNGLRAFPTAGCQRENIENYFAEECEWLGYSVFLLSSLSQPSTRRQRRALGLTDPELIELNEAMSAEVLDEMRRLEGGMIELHAAICGERIPWNRSCGRVPRPPPDCDDETLFLAVGAFDCLLHARRTIRQLANDAEANMFEEYLHGARIRAMILSGPFQNDRVRRFVTPNSPGGFIAEQILSGGYLDQRNPLTIGRVLEPPDSADSRD
jgi:hypothetical protein